MDSISFRGVILLLNNGVSVDVVGNLKIDNQDYMICKLEHAAYVKGVLVRYINLPKSEFAEYVEQIRKESEMFVVKEPKV